MSNVLKTYVPWRDRAFLSLDEAGVIVARSADWVRTRICDGQLEGIRLQKGGPLVVTVLSLAAFIDRTGDEPSVKQPEPSAAVHYPHLAWVNPQIVT